MTAYGDISGSLLLLLGSFVGLFGTLVGAGGGFLLVPALIFLFPKESADRITAISMAVVFCNALSGTIAYARMGRVDFASGWRFAAAALPGAALGAFATQYMSRLIFDRAMGVTLILIAMYLLWQTFRHRSDSSHSSNVMDETFVLSDKGRRIGAALSSGVGFVSSALGIGGGIVHVPALIYVLAYPVHIATATSHFVLAWTSLAAVIEHMFHHSYLGNFSKTAAMATGAVFGAQVGARLSTKVNGPVILGGLAVAQGFVGFRILLRTFG